jgi:hypothetical protein
MQNHLLLTVIAGVSVFVLGQYFLKLVLEPIVALREKLGELSHLFLFNQAMITNAHSTRELVEEVKQMSAQLLAKIEAILGYRWLYFIFGLPAKQNFTEACWSLNLISHLLMEHNENSVSKDRPTAIYQEMKTVQEKLCVRIFYSK